MKIQLTQNEVTKAIQEYVQKKLGSGHTAGAVEVNYEGGATVEITEGYNSAHSWR